MEDKKFEIIKDRAWEKVYSRIEDEGLLEKQSSMHSSSIHFAKWIVASVAAVILVMVILLITDNRKDTMPSAQHLISMINNDTSTSLVKTLEDNSVVYLSGKTSLSYPQHFAAKERKVFLSGNAMFDVAHNHGRSFLIQTKRAIVQVIGTCFNVKSNKDHFELGVFRGEVKVTDRITGKRNMVKVGEKIVISNNGISMQKADLSDMSKYCSSIKFKDETLANIIKVVNDNNHEQKICISKQLSDRRLTVSFTDESPSTIAQLLCATLDLHYEVNNNVINIK